MPEGVEPTLHNANNKVTPIFVDIQIIEKFHIDPLEYFGIRKSIWQSDEGMAIKNLLFAYHQISAEEDQRIHDEMDHKTKETKQPRGRRGKS